MKRILGMLMVLVGLPTMAQLTATVTPGYQFSAGEVPTTATLNQLGQPNILISGTVSGTVGLAAGSVSGVYLADSVPDGLTLNYNGSSPRQLQVKPSGISSNQIAMQGVQGTNIANNTVTTTNLAVNAVMPTNIFNGPITLSGTTPTVDWSTCQTFMQTLSGSTTYTFANVGSGESITLILIQDATGSRTVTWPAGIKWRGGAAPLLTTTAGHADVITLLRASGNYYGNYSLNFF